jgi:hypothetical protein
LEPVKSADPPSNSGIPETKTSKDCCDDFLVAVGASIDFIKVNKEALV